MAKHRKVLRLVLICSTKEVSSELSCEQGQMALGVGEEHHSEECRGQKALRCVKESEQVKALHGFAWVLQAGALRMNTHQTLEYQFSQASRKSCLSHSTQLNVKQLSSDWTTSLSKVCSIIYGTT